MCSNYEFRGLRVSIKEHWEDGLYMLIDNETQKPILVGSQPKILEMYDKMNLEDGFVKCYSVEDIENG